VNAAEYDNADDKNVHGGALAVLIRRAGVSLFPIAEANQSPPAECN
jgi:hypothetical protein